MESSATRHLSRERLETFRVEFPPNDVIVDSGIVFHNTTGRLGCDRVAAKFSLRDHDGILSDAVLFALLGTRQNGIQAFVGSLSAMFLRNRNDPIAIRCAALDDGTGPNGNEIIGDALNVRGDAFTFSVKQDDATKARFLEDGAVDIFHLF